MAETIQEYLVKLGFQVEQSQQNRFTDGLKSTHVAMDNLQKVVSKSIAGFYELATAAGGTAIAIATALGKIAMGMATMSFQAQRVGASAANIHALGFAFTQAGGSVEEANSALESYATNLRMIPGLEQNLKTQYGVTATDKAEQLTQIGAEMRRRIESAGPEGSIGRDRERATQILLAQSQAHLSELQSWRMTQPQFNPAYNQARGTEQRSGTDWGRAAEQGKEYRRLLVSIRDEFDNLKTRGYSEFADSMNAGLTKVEGFLKTHDKQIGDYLASMARNFEGVTSALEKWYASLNKEQQGQVQTGAVVGGGALIAAGGAAVVGGVLGKLGIPGAAGIARIGFFGAAIVALTNDYATWKRTEGKEGLINWSVWEPYIKKASDAVKAFNDDLIFPLADKLGFDRALVPAFEGLAVLLVGPKFLGLLKSSGLWAFFTFLRSGLGVLALPALLTGSTAAEDLGPKSENPNWDTMTDTERQDAREKYNKRPGFLGRIWNSMTGGGDAQAFHDQTYGDIKAEAEKRNLPHPEVIASLGAAQASVESTNGTSDLAMRANNLFGIKPGTPGGVGESGRSGDYVSFESREAAAKGYLDFITKNKRYEKVLTATSVPDAAGYLARSGYAEDPNYESAIQDRYRRYGGIRTAPNIPKIGPTFGPQSMAPPAPPPATVPAQRGEISFNSQPTITVTGVSDPQLAANHVARASERQNADVLRRLQSVYA